MDLDYDITIVSQGLCPRFAYTVRAKAAIGFDLLIPGISTYSVEDVISAIEGVFGLASGDLSTLDRPFSIGALGCVLLREVDESWVRLMALEALDFYGELTPFMQICPVGLNVTIDTPDLSQAWDSVKQPVWRWLKEAWTLPVPASSTATTNLAALRGERITEAARWEVDDWELFAGSGPDTPEDELRVLPLATFLAADPSIYDLLSLGVGKAVWRNVDELDWHEWKSKLR